MKLFSYKNIFRCLGITIAISSSILQFIFYCMQMIKWFGFFLGFILSVILAPGFIIFPIIFWIVERTFPLIYFLILTVGIISPILFYMLSDIISKTKE